MRELAHLPKKANHPPEVELEGKATFPLQTSSLFHVRKNFLAVSAKERTILKNVKEKGGLELQFVTTQYDCAKCPNYHPLFIHYTGCPRKNETDLNNSNGSCLILVGKQLFLFKFAIIGINSDIFFSIFGDLVVKLKISKLQNCLQVKTRAATLVIVD